MHLHDSTRPISWQTLPSTMGNLMELHTLILNRNKLTILPLTIGESPVFFQSVSIIFH
jgi:hypothetical protein